MLKSNRTARPVSGLAVLLPFPDSGSKMIIEKRAMAGSCAVLGDLTCSDE